MTEVWIAIAAFAVVAFAIKAAGPVLIGARKLAPDSQRVIALLPAALFSALVVSQTFAAGRALVLDARVGGLLAAIVVSALRASVLVVLVTAALTAALLRLL